MRGYKFRTELQALRNRVRSEHNLESKYVLARYANIRPVNITIEDALKVYNLKPDERREVRLGILSLWVGEHVTSSYDLTIYQCSTILDFLEYDNRTFSISERAKRFLEDSKRQVESGNLLFKVNPKPKFLEEASVH